VSTADELAAFGCAVVRGAVPRDDLAAARGAVRAFVALRGRWAGFAPIPDGDDFDAGFLPLCGRSELHPLPFARSVALAVPIQGLASHPVLTRLTGELTGSDLLSVVPPAVLIGPPGGGEIPWHADGPSPADARRGVTYLIPFRDVPAEAAPRVGRSAAGPAPIPLGFGDVLVVARGAGWCVPANPARTTRWLIEVRHGNDEHPAAVVGGWPDGRPVG
jgi:hypothetical protein